MEVAWVGPQNVVVARGRQSHDQITDIASHNRCSPKVPVGTTQTKIGDETTMGEAECGFSAEDSLGVHSDAQLAAKGVSVD